MIFKLANISEIQEGQWYEFNLPTGNTFFPIMLKKDKDEYFAFKNFCPHQGRRMNYSVGQFLTSKEGNLVCPAHGAEFNSESGLCINGPCLGESLEPIHIQLNEEIIFDLN